jgi:hypothetical protein
MSHEEKFFKNQIIVSALKAALLSRKLIVKFLLVSLKLLTNPENPSWTLLKVPKREIFDRSVFTDFYTIKSLRVGDFGVKIKKILQNI